MYNKKDAIQILVFSVIAIIITVTIAIIFDKIFMYGGALISFFWTIRCINYLIRNRAK